MIIIYFLQEMDLLVLDPTVLTMVGRYRADVFGVPAQGDNDRQTFPSENGQYTGFKVHRLG